MGAKALPIEELAQRYVDGMWGPGTDDTYVELFADKITVWRNFDHDEFEDTGERHAAMRQMFRAQGPVFGEMVPSYRLEDIHAIVGSDEFAVTWVVCVDLPDGTAVRNPHCTVLHVTDGRITRVDDYSDFEQATPMREAIQALGENGDLGETGMPKEMQGPM
jgi:ketosteroid isomerase-like protein